MNEFWKGLSERSKLFVISLFICIPTIVITYIWEGLLATIILIGFLVFFFFLTKSIWRSKEHGRNRIRRYSLFLVASAVTLPWWEKYVRVFVEEALQYYLPERYENLKVMPEASPYFTLILLVIVILLINYWMRDKTGMVVHPVPIDEEFPELNYKQSLRRYCRVVKKTIEDLDLETNWSAEDFTPLKAKVEVNRNGKRKKKIKDLLKAIKNDHQTKVFLVVGDPGAGKSVAMRKLCLDLLSEVERTGKVPIYVNLKEWLIVEKWTKENPPSSEQLLDFILQQLKGKDVFADEFLKVYFKKMLESGRFFLILDSFDEIPLVLDEKEGSWLIDKLSEVIYYTLAGANDSRGILASRGYRKPTSRFAVETQLFIHPFSEERLSAAFQRSISFSEEMLEELFNNRIDLIPIARNPFSNSLIASYARNNDNNLPKNQSELYYDYLRKQLLASEEQMIKHGMTEEEVLMVAMEVAFVGFKKEEFGLEVPVDKLVHLLPSLPIKESIEILTYARIARIGQGLQQKFSFVHRRFNEYFIAQKLLLNSNLVPKDSIPSDSRWRDALVLYCELAPLPQAKDIANYCWEQIKVLGKSHDSPINNLEEYVRALHCLRFIVDAFRGRLECMNDFHGQLDDFIFYQAVRFDNSILVRKQMVEATGIMRSEKVEAIIAFVLEYDSKWTIETAISSCKYLPRLSTSVTNKIFKRYVLQRSELRFVLDYRELVSSIRYSNAFIDLKRKLQIYLLFSILFLTTGLYVSYFDQTWGIFYFILFIDVPGKFFRGLKIFNDGFPYKNYRLIVGSFWWLFMIIFLVFYVEKSVEETWTLKNTFEVLILMISFPSMLVRLRFSPIIDGLTEFRDFNYKDIPSSLKNIPRVFLGSILLWFMPMLAIWSLKWRRSVPDRVAFLRTASTILVKFVSLYGLISYFIGTFQFFGYKVKWFTTVLFLLGIFESGVIGILNYVIGWFFDRKTFKKIRSKTIKKEWSRKEIYKCLSILSTGKYKRKFLLLLHDEEIIASGEWPTGVMPFLEEKEGNSILGQLEERWLGLSA